MDSGASITQCSALNVSDEKRCEERATSLNGLFCAFHAKQCQGLYRGYKTRNARLDRISANPPAYLKESTIPLTNQTFEDVKTEALCRGLHDYLFLKYQLLERVIRARKLHHARFFAMNMDYGHAKFLDSLQGQKAMVTKALERLGKRTAELMYNGQEWFKWVRTCQDEEEENRDKEQKKVKMEAALFRRHWKAAQLRMRDKKMKEDQKKQDAFLEKIYKERLAEQEANGELDDDDEMDWDPIEDVLEDGRGNYLDLIRHFLWMPVEDDATDKTSPSNEMSTDVVMGNSPATPPKIEDASGQADIPGSAQNRSHSKKSRGKAKKAIARSSSSAAAGPSNGNSTNAQPALDKNSVETKEQIYDRLKYGVDSNEDQIRGLRVAGTLDNLIMDRKTKRFPDDEIKTLLDEVSEIKHLLFCRLLLGHAALLPAALHADSVEAFLADEQVTSADLRDLSLKMANPDLQVIRDACADLFRSEEEEEDVEMHESLVAEPIKKPGKFDDLKIGPEPSSTDLPEKWVSQREKARMRVEQVAGSLPSVDDMFGGLGPGVINFGEIKDENQVQRRKIRVKVCGRTIWNYPSNKAMNRGGWLHFCIIAKDSNLFDAIALCRHWDEFFELNILACYRYFPGANWAEWVGSRYRSQLLQLGFIIYYDTALEDAESITTSYRVGGSRGNQPRKAHAIIQMRNFFCAHIKRDDQASRRFIQYLSMQTHTLLVLVRDAETGRLIIKPPEDEKWLIRKKVGLGRPGKNEWTILRGIGPQFFEEMDKLRKWHFSFKEYYDIYIWDREPGQQFPALNNNVQEALIKALRCRSGIDLYRPAMPILKTLYHDPETLRVRDIKPTDEGIESIYDRLHSEESHFYYGDIESTDPEKVMELSKDKDYAPKNLFYNEADALEDEILFPEERTNKRLKPSEIAESGPIRIMETQGFNGKSWVTGAYTFEDSDYDENDWMDDDDDDEDKIDPDAVSVASADGSEWEDTSSQDDEADISAMNNMTEVFKVLGKIKTPSKDDKPLTNAEMEEEFSVFLDKEKSKIFKEVWHKADLDPDAQEHYLEMKEMVKASRRFNQKNPFSATNLLVLRLIKSMNVDPDNARDVQKAVAKVSPFFSQGFLNSAKGQKFKSSLLFKQDDRSKMQLDRRTHISTANRPESFYEELDNMEDLEDSVDNIPFEWDLATRPILAHLCKAGVIRNHDEYFAGQAFAATEPARDKPDLYIDLRPVQKHIRFPKNMEFPTSIPPLKSLVTDFVKSYGPTSRFALLRIWSAPHFYPLMIGYDNRDNTSFRDPVGRMWTWLFIPKDMPFSEYSMHTSMKMRVDPYRNGVLGKQKVVVMRDRILVMGRDEGELLEKTAAAVLAVQGRPWRWEVDLWKSFVNVTGEFVERLRADWVD